MNNLFLMALTAILLLPLIPAFLLYKFLPSKTTISGPFKGLDLKLTGAFGGFFLLVLTSIGVFFPLLKNEQQKKIDELEKKIATFTNTANQQEEWRMHGMVASSTPQSTSLFFNHQIAKFEPTGEFEMSFAANKRDGKTLLPKSVCIFNKVDGYKVINISRELPGNADLKNLNIQFNDSMRYITVGNVIDIQSKEKNRVEIENNLLQKIKTKEINPLLYTPVTKSISINPDKIKNFNEIMKVKSK